MWTEEVSVEVGADPDCLWTFFANVDGWTKWNVGIEHIEILGPFKDGTEFIMQPPGMEPFVSRLSDVRPGQSFSDITVLDGTTITVNHILTRLGSHLTRVTYRAEVTGPEESQLGLMVTADFPDVLNALKRLAESEVVVDRVDRGM